MRRSSDFSSGTRVKGLSKMHAVFWTLRRTPISGRAAEHDMRRRMREAKQRLWGTLGMLLLTLLAVVGCGERDSGAGKALQVPVRVAESQPMVGSRTFTGRAEGARVVEVRARVDGTLQNRAYIEGTQVEAGQVLFRTDPRRYEVRVQRAEAELERAKAEVRQAE